MQLACNTLWIGENIVWNYQMKTKFVSKSRCSKKKSYHSHILDFLSQKHSVLQKNSSLEINVRLFTFLPKIIVFSEKKRSSSRISLKFL